MQPKFHCDDVSDSSAADSACINDGIGASSDGDFDINLKMTTSILRRWVSPASARVESCFQLILKRTNHHVEEIEARIGPANETAGLWKWVPAYSLSHVVV